VEHQRNRSWVRDLAAEPHQRTTAGEVTCNRPASPKTVTHVLIQTEVLMYPIRARGYSGCTVGVGGATLVVDENAWSSRPRDRGDSRKKFRSNPRPSPPPSFGQVRWSEGKWRKQECAMDSSRSASQRRRRSELQISVCPGNRGLSVAAPRQSSPLSRYSYWYTSMTPVAATRGGSPALVLRAGQSSDLATC
jgi:hypothetical protein